MKNKKRIKRKMWKKKDWKFKQKNLINLEEYLVFKIIWKHVFKKDLMIQINLIYNKEKNILEKMRNQL